MATLIGEGARQAGLEVATKPVGKSRIEDVKDSDLVLLGCSAMGVEEIDSSEMEPYIRKNEEAFADKRVALFGSYGWGEGEWMEDWEVMMTDMGARIEKDSLIILEMPEGQSEEECIHYGETLGQLL